MTIELVASQNPETAAITATTQNTKKEDFNTYFDLIKKELNKLLCDNPEYQKEKEELSGIINSETKKMLILNISGVIDLKLVWLQHLLDIKIKRTEKVYCQHLGSFMTKLYRSVIT